MNTAVIRTGGKQYVVQKGDVLDVELLDVEPGKTVQLETLLLTDGKKTDVGTPVLDATVEAKVIEHGKDKKVRVAKHRRRKRSRKVYGHRQPFTTLEIIKIG